MLRQIHRFLTASSTSSLIPYPLSFNSNLRYTFRTITPQDYLQNQRQSTLTRKPHIATLQPLQNSNHGHDFQATDQIKLIGTPKGQHYQANPDFDAFQQVLTMGQRDMIFLQIDPSPYIARERFMSHRCAMGQVQDYRLDGVKLIDCHKPHTWEETVVNLLTLDLLRENKLPKDFTYKSGLYSYSYPYVQDPEHSKAVVTSMFINQISEKVLGGRRTGYNMIDKVLYASLMGKHKVMLGGMPETLCRMILGKSLTIHQTRDIFRLVLDKNSKLTIPFATTADACENFLPHIFNLPKDLYMTAMLKQTFQATMQMVAVVGIQNWRPIQQYWVPSPYGINYTDATQIPEGFAGETVEDLIEKQAIFDVLLQTRTWSEKYLANPFPYLFEDITKIDKKDLQHYKKLFLRYYHQYKEFKRREMQGTKTLPSSAEQRINLLSNSSNLKKQKQELFKLTLPQQPGKQAFSLNHLKNKMNLDLDKSGKKIKEFMKSNNNKS